MIIMIIKNAYEVVSFIKELPTVELQNKFLTIFREDYEFEIYTIDDYIDAFIFENIDELIELDYIEVVE